MIVSALGAIITIVLFLLNIHIRKLFLAHIPGHNWLSQIEYSILSFWNQKWTLACFLMWWQVSHKQNNKSWKEVAQCREFNTHWWGEYFLYRWANSKSALFYLILPLIDFWLLIVELTHLLFNKITGLEHFFQVNNDFFKKKFTLYTNHNIESQDYKYFLV